MRSSVLMRSGQCQFVTDVSGQILGQIFKCLLVFTGNIVQKFLKKFSVISSNVFLPLEVISYRRFGITYWSHFQVSFSP
jgi:hypothetical protein